MSGRGVARMAPDRYARSPQSALPPAHRLWTDLRAAFVPETGNGTTGGMTEVLTGAHPSTSSLARVGEACGRAASAVGTGLTFVQPSVLRRVPANGALTALAFLVRRDSSANLQSVVGTGGLGLGGWTFQLNYGLGEIGLTRWGIADNKSTTLGAVPNTGGTPSVVAVSYDGSNARFMLNGVFQTVASGAINASSSGRVDVARNCAGVQACVNSAFHVVYVWARALADAELLQLWRDPWLVLRPRVRHAYSASAAAPGTGARVFVPSFVG